jgi:hypothetical protein
VARVGEVAVEDVPPAANPPNRHPLKRPRTTIFRSDQVRSLRTRFRWKLCSDAGLKSRRPYGAKKLLLSQFTNELDVEVILCINISEDRFENALHSSRTGDLIGVIRGKLDTKAG